MPLQLLDLAYRYTSSILSDAAHLAAEGYTLPDTTGPGASSSNSSGGGTGAGNAGRKAAKATNEGDVTLPALRLATSSRLGHSFSKGLQKSTLMQVAEERNRVKLPEVGRQRVFGVRLPEERFLLTGRGWNLGVEEEDMVMDEGVEGEGAQGDTGDDGGREGMVNGVTGEGREEGQEESMEDEDEDGEGGFEDVFGEQADEGDADQEDENMEDG